jgi:hypothetical protein
MAHVGVPGGAVEAIRVDPEMQMCLGFVEDRCVNTILVVCQEGEDAISNLLALVSSMEMRFER